jgi:hypothetical protein
MIIRTEKNANYTTISNFALNDSNLSLKAKGLWAYIMSQSDEWKINYRGLMSQLKEGQRSILGALHELEDAGYLIRGQTHQNDGTFTQGDATLYEQPCVRNARTENVRTKINTNKTNKKIYKKRDANASEQPSLSLLDSSRSDNQSSHDTDKRRRVVNKSTNRQELLSLVEELHKTIKGPDVRPLEKPELRVESLRKRLKTYTWTELLLAAKNLAHDAWFSGEGKKHQTIDFLLQNNRNQASGDNILRFIEIEPDQNTTSWSNAIDRRYGLATT